MENSMPNFPQAKVLHQMNGRIRFRVTNIRSDRKRYFASLAEVLDDRFSYQTIRVNPVTGSVLLEDPALDADAVAAAARSENLFRLRPGIPDSPPLVTRHVRTQVHRMDKIIRTLTGNHLNMSGSVFLALVFHAIREIVRGNLTPPSWFTALWVAASLYNGNFSGPGSDISHHDGDTGGTDAQ